MSLLDALLAQVDDTVLQNHTLADTTGKYLGLLHSKLLHRRECRGGVVAVI